MLWYLTLYTFESSDGQAWLRCKLFEVNGWLSSYSEHGESISSTELTEDSFSEIEFSGIRLRDYSGELGIFTYLSLRLCSENA